jgi:hypothetical protein
VLSFRLGSNPSHSGVNRWLELLQNLPRNPPAFLNTAARIHLSHLFRDPFVAAAFRTAEDDGLAPSLADVDRPNMLNGGAAERVLEMVEN